MSKNLLSVVIPAHNEEGCIENTVSLITKELEADSIDYEIVIVNDHSSDKTEQIIKELSSANPCIKYVENQNENGFGYAVATGLNNFEGEYVAVMMADNSDDPKDLVRFYLTAVEGNYDCVFGTRFSKQSKIVDYPLLKMFFNRMGNFVIQLLFLNSYNDFTNAFKLYKKDTIKGLKPFLSRHFNLTVELPLKAVIRGYSYKIVPNNWYNRTEGLSKFKIKELSNQYMFIIFYCLLEKIMLKSTYHKK